ncbi:MAG: HAD-IIIC family phosphatase [Caulobacteraceae bacterium]
MALSAHPTADDLRRAGRWGEAALSYERECQQEIPPAQTSLLIARACSEDGDPDAAARWLTRVVDAGDAFLDWRSAAARLDKLALQGGPGWARRRVRAWLCGSYTTVQLAPLLRLAALREGVWLDLAEGGYDQYAQEILDPNSALYAYGPDLVILAVHAGAADLPAYAEEPGKAVAAEVARWVSLSRALSANCGARLVMHSFAAPSESAFGHLTARLPGARNTMLRALNAGLAEALGEGVALVDCEQLSALVGKQTWFSPRHWHSSKMAVSLEALPVLARHTAAVMASALGLQRKCVVLDLDNTLWGGVVGEEGVDGVKVGAGDATGEAFLAFQTYLKALQARGVLLAVCSKNEDRDARAPFLSRSGMALGLEDFSAFVANWEPKPENLRRIAESLGLGLDALVFVDDNPVERALVRKALPEVEVPTLPLDPADYVGALAGCPGLEPSGFTAEDARRTVQYRARAEAARLGAEAGSLEAFHRSLDMRAAIAPIAEADVARVVQLLGKTNQFNLTVRRHSEGQLRAILAEPGSLHFTLRLRDRFADHGLVGVIIARRSGDVLEVDTFLMSCRVLGRDVEAELLSELGAAAIQAGNVALWGVYIAAPRNAQVEALYARFGFSPEATDEDGMSRWRYDLSAGVQWSKGLIARTRAPEGSGILEVGHVFAA